MYLKDLDERLQRQFSQAGKALKQGGTAYAIQVCGELLRKHPGAFEARRLLWESLEASQEMRPKPLGLLKAKVTGVQFRLKVNALFKKDVLQVVYRCDEALMKGEIHRELFGSLGRAAQHLDWPETKVFACWAKVGLDPEHVPSRLALANVLLEVGRPVEAIEHVEWILSKNPSHGEAQTLLKNASVAETLQRGNWEETDTTFFRKLKGNN